MEANDPDLPDAAVEHVSQMLTLAKSKHQEAIELLGIPDANVLPRLREALRLLEEVELLADDATSYINDDVLKVSMEGIHFQQASIRSLIARAENVKVRSPWTTPWPWISLLVLSISMAQLVLS